MSSSGLDQRPTTQTRQVLVLSAGPLPLSGTTVCAEGRALRWTGVASKELALERLQAETFDVLLLGTEHAELKFLEAVQKAQPTSLVVFLTEREVDPALVKLAMRLDSFVCLSRKDKGDELARQLDAILFPRAETRHRVRGSLQVELPRDALGSRGPYPLWDISHSGLSWITEIGSSAGPLLPETRIADLKIWSGDDLILHAPLVIVRNLVTLSDGTRGPLPTHYRVGASFAFALERMPKAERYVREPVKVVALLQRALRANGISFHLPYQSRSARHAQEGDLDAGRPETLTIAGRYPDDWTPGTVLSGSFELAGWGYAFLTSVMERAPRDEGCSLALKTPSVIKASKRRDARRCLLPDPSPVTVSLRSPFLHHTVEYPVVEVSALGLSFRLIGHDTTLPPGTRIGEMVIRGLAPEPLTARAAVLFVRKAESSSGKPELHCGVSLAWSCERHRVLAADAVVHLQSPKVTSGQGMSFDDLWSFFKRVGFVYPEKEESFRPILGEVRDNVSRMLQSPLPSILKTIVFKDDEQVYGHQSLLRAYEYTWFVQHLSADPTGRRSLFAARDANIGITDHMNQSPEVRWIKSYFQPQKDFPDRLGGGFARKMSGSPSSDLRVFSYLVSPALDGPDSDAHRLDGVEIRRWVPDDYKYIEACFVERGRTIELNASDISQDRLELKQIGAIYNSIGLKRWREVWVAERHGRIAGFVLIEFSSIGLNLSDITNHAAIYSWDEDIVALRALARVARRRYQELGRSYCILLCHPSQVDTFEAVGFKKKRDYSCWTLERSLLPEYREHTLQILSLGHKRQGAK